MIGSEFEFWKKGVFNNAVVAPELVCGIFLRSKVTCMHLLGW
jgi:hypothetical protein